MRRLAVATAFVALAAGTKPKTIAVEARKGWDHGRGRRCNVVGSTHAAKLRCPCAVTSAVLHASKSRFLLQLSLVQSWLRFARRSRFMSELHGRRRLPSGTWCSGITSAPHAEGPGFNPQCVHLHWPGETYRSQTCPHQESNLGCRGHDATS